MLICLAKDFFSVEKMIEKELLNENIIDEKSKLDRKQSYNEPKKEGKGTLTLKKENKDNKPQKKDDDVFLVIEN